MGWKVRRCRVEGDLLENGCRCQSEFCLDWKSAQPICEICVGCCFESERSTSLSPPDLEMNPPRTGLGRRLEVAGGLQLEPERSASLAPAPDLVLYTASTGWRLGESSGGAGVAFPDGIAWGRESVPTSERGLPARLPRFEASPTAPYLDGVVGLVGLVLWFDVCGWVLVCLFKV